MRDFQVSRVYRFDWKVKANYTNASMSLEECVVLINKLYARYGLRPPTVKDGRGRSSACGDQHIIKLPVFARNPEVVIHECAHGFKGILYGRDLPTHGKEFVAVMIEMFEWFYKHPASEFKILAKSMKVKVGSIIDVWEKRTIYKRLIKKPGQPVCERAWGYAQLLKRGINNKPI